MPDPIVPDPTDLQPDAPESAPANESTPSFQEAFSEYEKSHPRKREPGSQGREATVIAITADSVILDIGFKSEGILPLTAFPANAPQSPATNSKSLSKAATPRVITN